MRGGSRQFLILLCICAFALLPGTRLQADDKDLSAWTERVPDICRGLERIRHLPFKTNVTLTVQNKNAFRSYVQEQIGNEIEEDNGEAYVNGLVKIGVLEEPVDLPTMLTEILESQVIAYYDPEPGQKVYTILATNAAPFLIDIISSHELCHALQDQHFDLHTFLEKRLEEFQANGDLGWAVTSLVEGDATLTMMMWTIMEQSGRIDGPTAESLVSMVVGAQAAMDFDTMMNVAATNLSQSAFAGVEYSSEDLKKFPRYLIQSLLDAYLKGALMVNRIRTAGGWEAVDALFETPPASSEQVLHPEKLIDSPDPPKEVRIPDISRNLPEGWRLAESNVLGELGIRIYLQMWLGKLGNSGPAIAAAAGWGGDQYILYNGPENEDLLIWKTVWDSREDASQFIVSYRTSLIARFPRLKSVQRSPAGASWMYEIWELEPGRYLKLARRDCVVGIVDTTGRQYTTLIWE